MRETLTLIVRLLLAGLILSLPATIAVAADGDTGRQFFDDETQTLLVGERQIDVFPSPSAIPLKRGVAVIFFEAGNVGLTFDMAAQVGLRLNDWGWDTLLVPSVLAAPTDSSSASDGQAISPRAGMNSLSPAFGYTDSTATFRQLFAAVSQHIADKEGFRMVITQGMTAALLLDTGSNDAITLPDTAIVLSPFWPQRQHNQTIAEHLAKTTFPVLDIGLNDYNHWSLATRQRRNQLAHTSLKLHYRQQAMMALGTTAIASSASYSGRQVGSALPIGMPSGGGASVSPFATQLTNRIYGWTTYLGW